VSAPPPPAGGRRRRRALAGLGLAAILGVHLWATSRVIPPTALRGPEPFYADDFALHAARATIVAQEIPRTGRLWVYDPSIMAGYPLGATVFDLDNVGTALAMAALRPLGPGVAFKVIVWLCLALAPLVIWAAARRLGATAAEAAAGAAAATVVAATAITFRLGMFANFLGCHLAVLVVALAADHLARPRLGSFVALVVVAAAGMLMHVFLAIVVLLPCGLLVLGEARARPGRTLVQAIAVALALAVLAAPWLVPFLRYAPVVGWDYPHHFFQTGPLGGVWQTLTVLDGWHLVLLALGTIGFAVWTRRVRGPLAVAYGAWVIVLLAASLQGSRIPFVGRFEPAHLVLPLAFALAPLAGIGAVAVVRGALGLAGIASPDAVAVLATLAFAPHFLLALRATAALPPLAASLPPDGRAFLAWLREHTDPTARILIEDRLHLERPRRERDVPDHPYFGGHLPAMLPQLLGRETIGGPYPEMPIRPHRADLASARFFGEDLASWSPERFAAQLDRYDVGWTVVWSTAARTYLEAIPAVVEPAGEAGPFHLFRTRRRGSFFLRGSGLIDARYDVIEVRNASPGGVVLKYHWYPGFCSDPPLPVGPYDDPDLAAPFIHVENGDVRDFVLRPARNWRGGCG
jgi:hypothetical protein